MMRTILSKGDVMNSLIAHVSFAGLLLAMALATAFPT